MQRLFLLFRLGQDRYALDSSDVAEVLALRTLKELPGAPAWVAGLLAHRSGPVPVIDLACRASGVAAARRTSTRLVLVHYRGRQEQASTRLLGLVLESATDTLRCDPAEFREYGIDTRDSPWLGPVLEHPQGLVQRVTVTALIPDDIHSLLFPDGVPA